MYILKTVHNHIPGCILDMDTQAPVVTLAYLLPTTTTTTLMQIAGGVFKHQKIRLHYLLYNAITVTFRVKIYFCY